MTGQQCNHNAVMGMQVVETRKSSTQVLRYRRCGKCGARIETLERAHKEIRDENAKKEEESRELQAALYEKEMYFRGLKKAAELLFTLVTEEGRGGEGAKA